MDRHSVSEDAVSINVIIDFAEWSCFLFRFPLHRNELYQHDWLILS